MTIVVKRVTVSRPGRRAVTQYRAHPEGEAAPLAVGRSAAEAIGHLVRDLLTVGRLPGVEVLDAPSEEGGAG